MSENIFKNERRAAGLYVHFPFCERKCPYCDFYSETADAAAAERFSEALILEARSAAKRFASGEERPRLATVYFGGGTPSIWDERLIVKTLCEIKTIFDVAAGAEITIEANPRSFNERKLAAWLDAGINRISLGVQSLDDGALKFLGRLHDAQEAERALSALAECGANFGADIIYAFKGDSPLRAKKDVEKIAAFNPAHISAYELTVHEGTRFFKMLEAGLSPCAEEDETAEIERTLFDSLAAAGYERYETSNFARDKAVSRHNCGYWSGVSYFGFGPSAHSYFYDETAKTGLRRRNAADADAYCDSVLSGRDTAEEEEKLSRRELLKERIMLGLRLKSGFDAGEVCAYCGYDEEFFFARFGGLIEKLEAGGLCRFAEGRVVPTDKGLDFADYSAARFFEKI